MNLFIRNHLFLVFLFVSVAVQAQNPRTLYFALDGVDYQTVNELYQQGHFKNFHQPKPLVSTFPSATTVGFTGLFKPLGAKSAQGYEVLYFDLDQNKILGKSPKQVHDHPVAYKACFDAFRFSVTQKAIMYMFPSMASQQDMFKAKKEILSHPQQDIFAYLGGTDGSSHLLGKRRTQRTLVALSNFLQNLQQEHQQKFLNPLRVVLFADHGFHYARMNSIPNKSIRKALKKQGLVLASSLQDASDVVIPRFGMIGAMFIFADVTKRELAAKSLSTVSGVDLVFWHNNNPRHIFVRSSSGAEARLDFLDGQTRVYRYVPLKGDPLEYANLKNSGRWQSDTWWQKQTSHKKYPQALFRIHEAFFSLVKNGAGVMASLKEGYQYGSTSAQIGTFTRLGQRGTHGSLQKNDTLAIAMSTDASFDPFEFLRYDDLLLKVWPQKPLTHCDAFVGETPCLK